MKKSIMRGTLPTPPGQTLVNSSISSRSAASTACKLGVQAMGECWALRTPDADVAALAKACRDAGVEPHSIYGGITFFREDEADRKRSMDEAHHVWRSPPSSAPEQLSSIRTYIGDPLWRLLEVRSRRAAGAEEKAESTHLQMR